MESQALLANDLFLEANMDLVFQLDFRPGLE